MVAYIIKTLSPYYLEMRDKLAPAWYEKLIVRALHNIGIITAQLQSANWNPLIIAMMPMAHTKSRAGSIAYIRARRAAKGFNWVTYNDLVSWTVDWSHELPRDYDVIVGVARSGFLVASIIALEHNKPLAAADTLTKNIIWHPDHRSDNVHDPKDIHTIFLVDDSVYTGRTMTPLKREFEALGYRVITGALVLGGSNKPDRYYKYLRPHTFEWELAHAKGLHDSVDTDLDGILCQDCTAEIDRDEALYQNWLGSVPPLIVPNYTIDAIISNRLECYRPATETWLERNHIKYRRLYLWNVPTKDDRKDWTQNKIAALLKEKPEIYYESDPQQAEAIGRITGIPTICPWKK
jgi:orotate phosphoribosyltransferase